MAVVRGRPLTHFYGEGLGTSLASTARISDADVDAMAASYQEAPAAVPVKKRRLRVVPPMSEVTVTKLLTFDDLSPAMRSCVRRECRDRGIDVSDVEVISATNVRIP
jgi:hypothetical protein